MKVFLSWSGESSRGVATALKEWMPDVLQAVQPWLSATDIEAGARWVSELQLVLEESRVGIICLTPENVTAPWILFEAGALSRFGEAYVIPYLIGFDPKELSGPLVQFQAIQANHDGTWSLMRSLNRALGDQAIDETRLRRIFDLMWPTLEEKLRAIVQEYSSGEESQQPSRKELGETLEEVFRGFTIHPTSETEVGSADRPPRVFLIHGHNEAVRETVARFIERLGPAVIILNEHPSQGRTIIEKFESLSDVDYAVALMTADDVGAANFEHSTDLQARARQNVIFELGFFASKLGRSRISVLYEEDIEIPSDFSGIIFIPIDASGGWKFQLARELKIAGLPIDLNTLI
ncbi:MAG TPA: TIR domain-containing protein [Longimicrobium sp.]|nr:TIR domain-containing protein [Longimicrobium sp.]